VTAARAAALAAAAAIGLASANAGSSASTLPGPAPQLRRDAFANAAAVARNAACIACHVEEASEWRTSRHAASFENGAFQRALAREAPSMQPFCRGCHAPEADPASVPSAALRHVGVGCVTCHEPLGPVVSAPRPGASPNAPHAVVRDPAFATTAACGRCHEFRLPSFGFQRTVTEHAGSGDARACADCHMPREGARKSHAFPGGYDEPRVRGAASITASRRGGDVRVRIAPRDVGHAFPTGDHFRRLSIVVEAIGADGAVVATRRELLSRHFEGGFGRLVEVGDDRPFVAPRDVDLDLGAAALSLPVRYRVTYERVEHLGEGRSEATADVGGSVELAHGTLAP
jgi:hypothetical protein